MTFVRTSARFLPVLSNYVRFVPITSSSAAANFRRQTNRTWCSFSDPDDPTVKVTKNSRTTTWTKGNLSVEFPNEEELERSRNEKVQRHEFYDDGGELIYAHDSSEKIDDSFDWGEFERAFGLDKYHDVKDLEDWDFKSADFEDDHIDLDDESKSTAEKAHILTLKKIGKYQRPTLEDDARREKEEKENWLKFEQFVENSLKKNASQSSNDSNDYHDNKVSSTVKKPRTPKRQIPDDGATRKLDRVLKKHINVNPLKEKQQPSSSSSSLPYSPRISSHDTPLPEELLRMPVNTRKPGYERRLQSLEAQMERIAVEVLGAPDNEFDRAGAIMQQVMLSPDGFTLKVYFEIQKPNSLLDKTQFAAWRKQASSQVRAALAEQLYLKRVPKVNLVQLQSDDINTAESSRSKQNDINSLFDQIAAERKRASNDQSSNS